MSQENVEGVRRMYEMFNEGGHEAVISGGFLSPEFVWDLSASGIPGLAGVYRGLDEVRAALEDWFRAFPFEEWEIEVEELIDHGDQVIAIIRQRARGASSGVTTEIEQGNVFTLREGVAVRADTYIDRVKALEAAGLEE